MQPLLFYPRPLLFDAGQMYSKIDFSLKNPKYFWERIQF
jgi:hypothetical protein